MQASKMCRRATTSTGLGNLCILLRFACKLLLENRGAGLGSRHVLNSGLHEVSEDSFPANHCLKQTGKVEGQEMNLWS